MKIYKWTRTAYERTSAGSKWHENKDKSEVLYITEDWMLCKTGEEEVNFFRAISSYTRVNRDPYHETVSISYISPDKLCKRSETFIPVSLFKAQREAGWREREALRSMVEDGQRILPVVMDTPEHLVLSIGENDSRVSLDLISMRWV